MYFCQKYYKSNPKHFILCRNPNPVQEGFASGNRGRTFRFIDQFRQNGHTKLNPKYRIKSNTNCFEEKKVYFGVKKNDTLRALLRSFL